MSAGFIGGAGLGTAGGNVNDGTANGQIPFWNNTSSEFDYTETSELVWDDTNKRFGVGVAAPDRAFTVREVAAAAGDQLDIIAIVADYGLATTVDSFGGNIVFRNRTGGNLLLDSAKIGTVIRSNNASDLAFYTNDGGGDETLTERMRISEDGNICIGAAAAAKKFEIVDTSGAQQRWSYTQGSVYADAEVNSSGFLGFSASGAQINFSLATTNLMRFTRGSSSQLLFEVKGTAYTWGINQRGGTGSGNAIEFDNVNEFLKFAHDVAGASFRWDVNSTEIMRLTPTGLGLGVVAPIAGIDCLGAQAYGVTVVNAATYTIDITDSVISVEYTDDGAVTLTLPACSTAWNSTPGTGIRFLILDSDCNASGNNITINRAGSDTIVDTATAQTSTVISSDGGAIWLQPINATTWKVF